MAILVQLGHLTQWGLEVRETVRIHQRAIGMMQLGTDLDRGNDQGACISFPASSRTQRGIY